MNGVERQTFTSMTVKTAQSDDEKKGTCGSPSPPSKPSTGPLC